MTFFSNKNSSTTVRLPVAPICSPSIHIYSNMSNSGTRYTLYWEQKRGTMFKLLFFLSMLKNFNLKLSAFCLYHRHLKIIDCLTARVFFISTVNGLSKKKKKRSLFCAALVAGTINKLEQSIFTPSISMVCLHLLSYYAWANSIKKFTCVAEHCKLESIL